MNEKYYKWFNRNGDKITGSYGYGDYDLTSTEWMPDIEGQLRDCKVGYHVCREKDLVLHAGSHSLWEVEVRDVRECAEKDKCICRSFRLVRQLRWDKQIARLFACDCAERVLRIANDRRSTNAVIAARKFAFGLIGTDELDAAWAAAWDARAAARAAAWDAWDARDAAGAAAWAAAWAAARAAGYAAWDAVGAARAAERNWQTVRLFDYAEGRIDLDELRRKLETNNWMLEVSDD